MQTERYYNLKPHNQTTSQPSTLKPHNLKTL